MRIRRLDMIAFGPFENTPLDLSRGQNGLHVIYGDNEDGKSTTLRAIRGLLFGIDERTADTFRFKPPQLRIGGCLRLASGEELAFVRRKGRKDTLLHPESGDPLPEDALAPFLGGLTPKIFRTLYGIDHDELVSGGRAIFEQTGDVGKALFSAATGTTSLKRLLETLDQDADQLFRPRAPKSRIYTLAREHADRLKEAREATLPSAAWTRLRRELDDATRAREELEEERRNLQRDLAQLERVRRVRPALAQRRRLLAEIEQLGEVVDLPEDFEPRRREATDSRRAAQERINQIAATLGRLKAENDKVRIPPELLEQASAIELFHRRLGAYEEARDDRPALDVKRRQNTNDARELLDAIQPQLDVKKVESLRPVLALKQSVQKLVSQHEQLANEELRAATDLSEARKAFSALQDERGRVKEDRDPTRLAAAVNRAQRAGDLDDQIHLLSERCEHKRRQCQREFDRLGIWQQTMEALEHAPLPSPDTIADFETRWQQVAATLHGIEDKMQESRGRRLERQETLTALEREGAVPKEDELLKARANRDRGWSLVRRRCYEDEDVEEEIHRYTHGGFLPDVYEGAVQRADEVSDRLRKDSDRVQQHQLHATEIEKLDRKLKALQADLEAQALGQDRIQREWTRLWDPAKISPQNTRAMAAWLRKAEALRQQLDELRGHEREHAGLTERRADLCDGLHKELKALGEMPHKPSDNRLGTILDHASLVLENIRGAIARMLERDKDLQKAGAALDRADKASTVLKARRSRWQREWDETSKDFGFLSDPGIARVEATLEKLDALFKAVDKANEAERRIYGIDKRISDFEAQVDRFARTTGRPREDQPVDQYVVGLNEALTRARGQETRRQGIRQQEADLNGERTDLQARVQSADANLSELRRMAGVETDEALIEAGRRSTRAGELRAQIAQYAQQLIDAGDGHSIDALQAQAEGVDGDDLDERIDRLTASLDRTEEELKQRLRREAELRHDVASKDGAATAAEATEQAGLALSQLREDVRTYLRLRCAALILNNHIERYRKENQDPLLKRAGELFSRLTLGSFKRLRGELDRNGHPVLKGVRPDDMEVGVDGMSDGTRDQLYLALRLATLEQHLAQGEPIPFIVDDILVGFDDRRTEACLKILAELVTRTQVLLFTHHQRVVEIAGRLGTREGVVLHRINDR